MTQSAQEMVDLYVAAEKAVLLGKTFTMNGRTLSMENLTEIREGRKEWERKERGEVSSSRRGDFSLATFQ